MAINLNYLKTRVVRYPLLALAVLAAIIATGSRFDLSKSDWSGWAQAIGATVGIAVAIYIPAKQRSEAARLEECRRIDGARRVCMAFKDELEANREVLAAANTKELLDIPEGGVFDRRVPLVHNRFPIYFAHIGRITEIDNEQVRHAIIDAYDTMTAYQEAATLNNQVLSDYYDAYLKAEENATEFNANRVYSIENQLRNSCAQMKHVAQASIEKVHEAITKLASQI